MMATEKENMAMTAETREQKPSMATCKEALADYRRIYLPCLPLKTASRYSSARRPVTGWTG